MNASDFSGHDFELKLVSGNDVEHAEEVEDRRGGAGGGGRSA